MSARLGYSGWRARRDKARLARGRRSFALSQVARDCLLEDRTLLATTQFALSLTSPLTAGGTPSFTIEAKDAQGQITPAYAGTVAFSSSDSLATLPPNISFAGSGGEVTVLADSLIFRTAGTDSLTVADTQVNTLQSTFGYQVEPPSATTARVVGGTLYVLGDAASDSVSLGLTGGGTQLNVANNGSAVAGSPFALSSFSLVEVIGGTGPLSLAVDTGLAAPSDPITGGIQFIGGLGGSTLIAPNQANQWSITSANAGTLDTAVRFSSVQNLTGSDGGDTFTFGPNGSVSGVIRGGPGGTTLDGGSGTLNLTNKVLTTGNLAIKAGTIAIGTDVTISSRQTGGADPLTGASTGNSGNITMTAPSITLNQGDLILAQVQTSSTYQGGNITLDAELSSVDQGSSIPSGSTPNQAQIQLTGATVEGANVSITAGAHNTNFYDDLGTFEADASEYINSALSQVPSLGVLVVSGFTADVVLEESTANILLTGSTVTGCGTVSVGTTATSNASLQTVAATGTADGGAFAIAVGYGQASSTATTTVTNSTITGGGVVAVTSSATTTAELSSRIAANSPFLGSLDAAMAVAIANTNETSNVTVSQGSSVTSTGSKILINAAGAVNNAPIASPSAAQYAITSAGVAVDVDTASIKTDVAGTVDGARGAPTATFNADPNAGPVAVNYQNSTITIPSHGFVDGTPVAYSNGGAASIGGLTSGTTYYVEVVDPNTIQLANGPSIPLSYSPVDPSVTPKQTLGVLSSAAFNPSDVDISKSTIQLTPSIAQGAFDGIPQAGDIVTYLGADCGTASDNVGRLVVGKQYVVQPVSNQGKPIQQGNTIQLIDPVTRAAVALTFAGNGTQGLLYESNVETFAPAQAVNTTNNTITFSTPDQFQTGDMVVYHTDPTVQDTVVLNNETLTEGDQPINGLEDGHAYYVVRLNANTIRLADSHAAALAAAPIALSQATGSDLGSQQALVIPGTGDAVDIHAGLNATNSASASTTPEPESNPRPTTATYDELNPAGATNPIAALSTFIINMGIRALNEQNAAGNAALLAEGGNTTANFQIAGAVGLTFVNHDVETTIDPTAQVSSSGALRVGSDVSESKQTSVSAAATQSRSSAPDYFAVAVGVGLYDNTAKATVDGGAQLNASGSLGVESTVSYPILLSNPLLTFNPLDYLTTDLPDNQDILYAAETGTLGDALNLFNTFAVATSDIAANPNSTILGGVFAYNQYTNVSDATLEPGALVNQNDDSGQPSPRFRTGQQAVSVTADTDMTLVNVVGSGALGLSFVNGVQSFRDLVNAVGSPVVDLLNGIQEFAKPLTDCGCTGIGAALDVDNANDSTIADIGAGARVFTGAGWSLSFSPAQIATGNFITSSQPIDVSTGAPVIYQTTGTPIGGLENGATYYAIADPTNPDQIQLARTPEDAAAGTAITLDPSQATGSQSLVAPSLVVGARTPAFDIAFAEAGANPSGFGLAGAITVGLVNNTTQARVEPGAQLQSSGGLAVSATDDLTRIGIDGGVARSQSTGVGISLGVNVISRDTEAYIGTGYDSNGNLLAPGNANTLVNAAGPIAIDATTTGNLWSAALAGAIASSSIHGNQTPNNNLLTQYAPTKLQDLMGISHGASDPATRNFGVGSNLGGSGQPQATISAAGAATVNIVTQENTRAFINDTGTIMVGQELALRAHADSSTWTLAGTLAVNSSSSQESSTGLAGAIGVNIIKSDDRAFVAAGQVTAGSLVVAAERSGGIRSLTAGGSGVTNQNGVSVAGSVSVNVILGSVVADIADANLTLASGSSVTAEDSSDIWAIGGAGAYGGKTGVGITVAVNILGTSGSPDQTDADVSGSTMNMSDGTLVVQAVNADPATDIFGTSADPRIIAFAGSLGADSNEGGIQGAGMVSVNILGTAAEASVTESTVQETGSSGTVSLAVGAVDSSGIVSIGGAIAGGMGTGIGAAVGYNEIDGTVSAVIDSSTVTVRGGVSATALSDGSVLGVAGGIVGGGGENLEAAASASVNLIQDVVQAVIVSVANPAVTSVITAAGPILVEASDTSSIIGAAGGLGFSGVGAAVGIAVTYNLIQNTIAAYTEDAEVTSTKGGAITFDADSSPAIIGVAAELSGSAGDSIAGAGSVAVNSIAGSVDAHVADQAKVQTAGDITIVAAQSAPMVSVAGGVAVTAGTALAGALSYNYIGGSDNLLNPNLLESNSTGPVSPQVTSTSEVTAYIDNATVISSAGSISIDGGLVKPGTVLATGVAPDPALSDRPVTQGTTVTFDPSTAVTTGGTTITVTSTSGLTTGQAVVYYNGGGGSLGTQVKNSNGTYVDDQPLQDGGVYYVIVTGPTTLELDPSPTDATSANPQDVIHFSLDGTTGTNHSLSVSQINALTGDQNFTLPLPVDLDTQLISVTVSGGLSLGAGIAVAGSVSLNLIRNSVDVGIHNVGSRVSARNNLTVGAADASKIDAVAGGISVSAGSAGIGGAVSYNDIQDTVSARIGSALAPTSTDPAAVGSSDGNSGIISAGTIGVSATTSADILDVTFDLSAASDFALGAAVAVNKIADTADAHVANSSLVRGTTAIDVTAGNTSTILAIAGSGAGSGSAAVGAGVGYNDITDTVLAFADDASLTADDPGLAANVSGGDIRFAATSAASIESISLGIAVAGDASLAGSGAGNLISNCVEALITEGSNVQASGNVTLAADSNNSTSAYGGSLGVGAYVGADAVNLLTNTTTASINDNSFVTANGQGAGSPVETWGAVANGAPAGSGATGQLAPESDHGVALTASTTETLNNITAAAGGATLGIGLNVLVNIVSDTTHATIDGANVRSTGTGSWVIVRAHEDTEDNNAGGALAAGLVGVGAGVNVDIVKNDTEALVTHSQPGTNSTTVNGQSGVEVSALNRTNVTTTAIGVAIAAAAAVAGSASGLESSSTTSAAVEDAGVTASGGPLVVAANDAVGVTFRDGAGAAGLAGIGGAVAVGIVNDDTTATLAGAQTNSGGDTDVEADSAETLTTQAGTAAVGVAAGVGATVAVMSLAPSTVASIDSDSDSQIGSNVQATGMLNVDANDALQLPGDVLGTGAAAAFVGVGVAVEVITVHDTVDAHIANAKASGSQGVAVEANGQRGFAATVVAAGGGGFVGGVDGAVSVLTLGADLDSNSSGQVNDAQSSANNSLLSSQGVTGLNTSDNQSMAQPGSIGTQLQSGAQSNLFTVSLAGGTSTTGGTQAYLGTGAAVTSDAGGLTVSATESVTVDDKIGGGALGLLGAAGASVGIANIKSNTQANVAEGATVSVAGNLMVSSTYSDNVTISAYGAQGAVGAALGAVYASIDDTSTQKSSIAGRVNRAHLVTITAQGPNPQGLPTPPPNHDLSAYDFGFTGGIAAGGATLGTTANTGTTSAYLDTGAYLAPEVGGLTVTATSGTLATTNMLITSAALVGVRVNQATTTITPTIAAYIGQYDRVNVLGDVVVAATSSLAEGHADAQSYGGGALADIGAGVSNVTTSPTVKGYIDSSASVAAGGDIRVTAIGADQTSPPVDPTGAFNPSTSVDTQTGTIAFPVNLATGAEVQYQADPTTNTPIAGLNSDQVQLTVTFQPRSGGDQILLSNGQVWTTFGFVPGVEFTLTDPNDQTGTGTFTVQSVYLNVLTVTASNVLDSASNQAATFNLTRIYRIMNPSITASGLDFENADSGNTITRNSGSWVTDGFVAGEQITITGSANAGAYTVKGVTDSTLTLLNVTSAPWAKAGTLTNNATITTQGAFRFGETFDASQVDTANDTITFISPDDLQTGDAIRIDTEGNPAIGNLDPTQTYYVRTVDAHTIQLCATLGDALATPNEVTPYEYNSSTNTFDLPELRVNQSAPIPVTYHAPTPTTFYARDVNVTFDDTNHQFTAYDHDTIYVSGTDLAEGTIVTYSFTGSTSPLVNLTQGEQVVVHIDSQNTKDSTEEIQLYAAGTTTPIALTTDPTAAGATMTLTRIGFGPLVAQENGQSVTLVDGNTYLAVPVSNPRDPYAYQIEDPATGAILTNFDTDPSAWDPTSVQTFTGGVLVITPSSGTQSMYIDLTSAPDQTDHLTAPSGAALSTLAPPAGTGVSTATTEGGGAGAGQFAFPSSTLTAEPIVWAYSAAANLTAGGDVAIEATSASNVGTTITNGGGGVLAVGQVTATVIQQSDTETFVGSPTTINGLLVPTASNQTISAANFTLTSNSVLISFVSAESDGGGAIGAAIAHTSDQVSESTAAQVGSGAAITATGTVTIAADAKKAAHTVAFTYFVAVGGGANSDQQDFGSSSPSGVNVGVMTPSFAFVGVGNGASLTGQTVSLKATESTSILESDATAVAFSPILRGVDVAQAAVNVVDDASTNVQIGIGASITGTQGVDVLSIFTPAVVTANPYALAVALIPVPIKYVNTPDSTLGQIDSASGATVTAGARSASGPLEPVTHDTSGNPVNNVALNVEAYEVQKTGAMSGGSIGWDANVNILGGAPSAYALTIDKDGNVTEDHGFSYVIPPNLPLVAVTPINTPGNSIYFYGEMSLDNIIAAPTFTFAPSAVSRITIQNDSDLELQVNPIDVTALGSQPEVYLDSPNQGIVNQSSAYNFHIATSEAQPSLVDIEDGSANGAPVLLVGINNPIGQTIIKDVHGDVAAAFSSSIIRTNTLDIVAGADVGPTGYTVPVEMVQYRDDGGSIHDPLLNVSAGGSIVMDLRGRQRDGTSNPVTIESEGIIAGGRITIDEEQGLADGPATGAGGGGVVDATQPGQIGTYNSYYYPDGTAAGSTAIDDGLYGNMNETSDVVTDYVFEGRDANDNIVNVGGITAAGDVQIVPSPTATSPTVNIEATLDLEGTTDTVSATT